MTQKIINALQQEVDKLDVTDPTQNAIAEGLLTAKRIVEKSALPITRKPMFALRADYLVASHADGAVLIHLLSGAGFNVDKVESNTRPTISTPTRLHYYVWSDNTVTCHTDSMAMPELRSSDFAEVQFDRYNHTLTISPYI